MEFKTKFNIGDKVFTIKEMRIFHFVIKSVSVYNSEMGTRISYSDGTFYFYEEQNCFRSEEELLNFIHSV